MDAEDDVIKNSCCLQNVEYVKKPTISGKIVDILPLIRKSRLQSSTVLIFHCIDASPDGSTSRKKFKIIFFADAAEKMWSLKLSLNDYIAIRKAVAFQDYAYSNTDLFYSKFLFAKSVSDLTKHISYKKKQEAWKSFNDDLSEESKKHNFPDENADVECSVVRIEDIVSSSNGINPPLRNETNDSNKGIISSTDWLMAVKKKTVADNQLPSNEQNHDKSETANVPESNESGGQISPAKQNDCQKYISPSKASFKERPPESVMQGIVQRFQHKNNEKNISIRSATSQLNCFYTKLGNINECMTASIIAVVKFVNSKTIEAGKKKCLYIRVADDTKPDGMKIRIIFNIEEDRPIIQPFCIILCKSVKISKSKDEFYGTIHGGRQIVTFDKDNVEIHYKQSLNYNVTSEDKERVEFLRDWMFEHIPKARPFTPLASIVNKNETINLRCQIVGIKEFDKNIIVLRVSDGTTCEVPFYRFSFECESWQSALAEMKSNRNPSKEIDIMVHVPNDNLYKDYKQNLKNGVIVELFNVSLKLHSDSVKTVPGNSLKAILEGAAENIRIIERGGEAVARINKLNKNSPKKNPKDNRKTFETKCEGPVIQLSNNKKGSKRLFDHSPRIEIGDPDASDFEKSLDTISVAPKKSKSVAESNEKMLRPITSPTSFTNEKSDAFMNCRVLPTDRIQNKVRVCDNDKYQSSLISDSDSVIIVQESQATKLINSMDSQLESFSLGTAVREEGASKLVHAHLHKSFKSVVTSERKEIEKRLIDYKTRNDVKDYLVQWPSDPGDEAFYIQVTIMSTIPFVNGTSSDFELLALISGYCNRCDSFFPFYHSKWIVSDEDGPVSICPNCKENDVMSPLKHELLCELLLSDDYGNSNVGVVMGHHAENFLSCTVSQLCSSVEAKIRVRTFLDSHLFSKGCAKKPLIVKVIRIFSPRSKTYKYHILS